LKIIVTFAEKNRDVVGGQLTLALYTDEEWGATTSAGKLSWKVGTLEQEGKSTFKLGTGKLN
jgi:hypothetical protein